MLGSLAEYKIHSLYIVWYWSG